jgi:hypothetical protein
MNSAYHDCNSVRDCALNIVVGHLGVKQFLKIRFFNRIDINQIDMIRNLDILIFAELKAKLNEKN